jgi:hypothetical protein
MRQCFSESAGTLTDPLSRPLGAATEVCSYYPQISEQRCSRAPESNRVHPAFGRALYQ